MESATNSAESLAASLKRFAARLLTIGENRLELLTVEVQEERERLLHAILLSLGVAVFGLLAGIMLSAVIVVLLWKYWPVTTLLTLTILHGLAAVCLYRRLTEQLRDWQTLSASLDQLRKDRACLEKSLE